MFLIAYIFWLISAVLGLTRWKDIAEIKSLVSYFENIAYFFWIVQFLFKRHYSKKDVMGIAIIIVIVVFTFFSKNEKAIVTCMIMIYLSANVNYKKILKCTLSIQLVVMLVTVGASLVGIIENGIWMNDYGRIRYDLGYTYCAYPAHLMMFITLIWFCLDGKKYFFQILLLLFLNVFIYYVTDSRADFYLSLIGMAGFLLLERKKRNVRLKKHIKFWTIYGCGIFSIFSILMHVLYSPGNAAFLKIDEMLSGRLKLGNAAIKEYGFALFGKSIRWIGMGSVKADPAAVYNYVDCAFLKDTLSYGLFFLAFLIIGFYFAGKRIIQQEKWMLAWGVIVSLLYAITNAHLCWVNFNVFILVLGQVFVTLPRRKTGYLDNLKQ